MPIFEPTYGSSAIVIVPWAVHAGQEGHDPRSDYVEQFWLPQLGPSTTWLARRVAAGIDVAPDGFALPLADTARALGLGDRGGRHSPFLRSINRLVLFDLATPEGPDRLAVRVRFPRLNSRQLGRLTPALFAAHQAQVGAEAGGRMTA